MINRRFEFGLDDLKFYLPWTRPTMFQLKAWHNEISRNFPLPKDQNLVLWGGFWSSTPSWDIDLFLVPDSPVESLGFPESHVSNLLEVYEFIRNVTRVAIEKYRFLVDITFAPWQQINTIAELFKIASCGLDADFSVAPTINCGYGVFKRAYKHKDGKLVFDVTKSHRKVISLGRGRYLFQKPGGPFDKQVKYIAEGRIYFDPVRLRELFD